MKYRVIERFRGKYSVESMCRIFEVSRSGYYAGRSRQGNENRDKQLLDLITECQLKSRQTYGVRRVRLWLEREKNKSVNIKAVRRIMRNYDLMSVIRRRKPYTVYKQAIHKYNNVLDRQFNQSEPNRFWVTDITYIPTSKGFAYMCAVVDLYDRMVLAYRIGNDMTTSLVTDTIREAMTKEKVADGLALHSDQGSQYTSKEYFDLTTLYHINPSMSTPGCPFDNAIMENFFGTLKVECLHRMKFADIEAVQYAVDEYVHFYNYERIDLKHGSTPFELRSKAV